MTIFLIGFMGSGKTTVGKKLAAKLKCEFIDLDAAIEHAEGKYIRDIIAEKGEHYFREIESKILQQLDLVEKVIATGGGTPYYFDNMDWMKINGIAVYIALDEGVLFSRLKTTNLDHRPLLKGLDDDGLKKFIHEKLEERGPYYYQAQIVYNPIKESLEHLIDAINDIPKLY
jgi:shikimate kinase